MLHTLIVNRNFHIFEVLNNRNSITLHTLQLHNITIEKIIENIKK